MEKEKVMRKRCALAGSRALMEGLESRVLLSTVAFWDAKLYQVGFPRETAIADFNGDGKKDLAVAAFDDNNVRVLLNRGNGTFAAPLSFSTSGLQLTSITHGDFNADGKEDIAVGAGTQVGVFFNLGGGRFGPEAVYPLWDGTSYGVSSITAGDFNGDGKTDLAATNTNNSTVAIYLNQGDGTFTRVDHALAAFHPLYKIAAADMNGDGRTDLVGLGSSTDFANPPVAQRVEVWLNDGIGGFQTAAYSLGQTNPDSLTVDDLDGDGRPEVVVGAPGIDFVSVFKNQGDGTLNAAVNYWNPVLRQVTTADINGDGKADLVSTAFSGTLSVRLNDGNGVFGPARILNEPYGLPWTVASGDFNGDGAADLVVGVGDTSVGDMAVMLNRNTPGIATTVTLTQSSGQSHVNEAVGFTAQVSPGGGGAATGRVRLVVDGVTWAVAPVRNGIAQFQTSALALTPPWPHNSPHTVVAVYDGDSTFAGSSSARVEHVVNAGSLASLHTPAGLVDVLNRQIVKGWASDPDTPTSSVEVQVVVDGRYVGSAVANEWRFNRPLHGFTFLLPTLTTGRHFVQVFTVDTWSRQPRLLMTKVV